MSDGPNPLVLVVLLVVVILLTELLGPAVGEWAVWAGRITAGMILIYFCYMMLGGQGAGALIFAALVVIGVLVAWFVFDVDFVGVMQGLAGIILPILVVIHLIAAFVNIVSGFRQGSNGLIIAGAIAGLMALASAPAISEPTILALGMAVLGLIVGVGGFLKARSQELFG